MRSDYINLSKYMSKRCKSFTEHKFFCWQHNHIWGS